MKCQLGIAGNWQRIYSAFWEFDMCLYTQISNSGQDTTAVPTAVENICLSLKKHDQHNQPQEKQNIWCQFYFKTLTCIGTNHGMITLTETEQGIHPSSYRWKTQKKPKKHNMEKY